jgi:hypothetical protein
MRYVWYMCRTCGTKFKFVKKKKSLFLFRAVKIWAVNTIFYEIVNCSNCYCSTFRADNNIIDMCSNLVNPFEKVDSSSLIYLFICSNGVEQSRFRCRADFLSRWISSSWPISLNSLLINSFYTTKKTFFFHFWAKSR